MCCIYDVNPTHFATQMNKSDDNFKDVTTFSSTVYLGIAEQGSVEVFTWNGAGFSSLQSFSTPNIKVTDIKFFQYNSNLFMVVANQNESPGRGYNVPSTLYLSMHIVFMLIDTVSVVNCSIKCRVSRQQAQPTGALLRSAEQRICSAATMPLAQETTWA